MSNFYFASVREILETGSYNGKLLFQNKTSKSDIYKQITVFLNNSLIIILKMDFLSIFAKEHPYMWNLTEIAMRIYWNYILVLNLYDFIYNTSLANKTAVMYGYHQGFDFFFSLSQFS